MTTLCDVGFGLRLELMRKATIKTYTHKKKQISYMTLLNVMHIIAWHVYTCIRYLIVHSKLEWIFGLCHMSINVSHFIGNSTVLLKACLDWWHEWQRNLPHCWSFVGGIPLLAPGDSPPRGPGIWECSCHDVTELQDRKQRLADVVMMTSSNGNILRITGHLCGEFTGYRWIPRIKASDAELWCFLWSAPE